MESDGSGLSADTQGGRQNDVELSVLDVERNRGNAAYRYGDPRQSVIDVPLRTHTEAGRGLRPQQTAKNGHDRAG